MARQVGPIRCQTCGAGTLIPKKISRMSAPVVVIGWLLLVPSFFGMLVGGTAIFFGGSATVEVSENLSEEIRLELETEGVPEAVISNVLAYEDVDTEGLTAEQVRVIDSAEMSLAAGTAGAAVGGGLGIFMGLVIGVCSFVGGLLGWLLVMKKKVLRCNACGAVVDAA